MARTTQIVALVVRVAVHLSTQHRAQSIGSVHASVPKEYVVGGRVTSQERHHHHHLCRHRP